MKKIMIMLAAMMGIISVASAASTQDLEAKVESLEKELSTIKTQMENRNAELLSELIEQKDMGLSADSGLTAGYDKNFYIKSADDEFRLDIKGRLQLRHTYTDVSHGDYSELDENGDRQDVSTDSSRFEFERTRLMFSGYAMKNLKFFVQLDMDDDNGHNAYLYSAWLAYSFTKEFGLRAGSNDCLFGKQRPSSSGKFMAADRGLVPYTFDMGRMTGIEAFGDLPMGETKLNYRVGLFEGLADNNDTKAGNSDNNPVFVARLALPLLGATTKDFSNESDLGYHENPVAMIGVSYAYANEMNEENYAGGIDDNYKIVAPVTLDGARDGYRHLGGYQGNVEMFGADVSYKYKGFSATVEGFIQNASPDSAYAPDYDNDDTTENGIFGESINNMGWYGQVGQFIMPEKFEIFGRVGGLDIDSSGEMYEYTGGFNYYISGQNLKVTMDLTYVEEMPGASISSGGNYQGEAGEALMMVRSQLQFQF